MKNIYRMETYPCSSCGFSNASSLKTGNSFNFCTLVIFLYFILHHDHFFSKLPGIEIVFGIYRHVKATYRVNCGKSRSNTREKIRVFHVRLTSPISCWHVTEDEKRLLEGEFATGPFWPCTWKDFFCGWEKSTTNNFVNWKLRPLFQVL